LTTIAGGLPLERLSISEIVSIINTLEIEGGGVRNIFSRSAGKVIPQFPPTVKTMGVLEVVIVT
jgi:hypothetical protein